MRRIVGLMAVWTALATAGSTQPLPADRVPPSVAKSFHGKFPAVDQVEWKLKSDNTYEAEFKLKGVEVAVKFDARAKWLETETARATRLSKPKRSSAPEAGRFYLRFTSRTRKRFSNYYWRETAPWFPRRPN